MGSSRAGLEGLVATTRDSDDGPISSADIEKLIDEILGLTV